MPDQLISRGLEFTGDALRKSLSNSTEELADSFTRAYNETLKKFHSFVVKPLFTVRAQKGTLPLPYAYTSARYESVSLQKRFLCQARR